MAKKFVEHSLAGQKDLALSEHCAWPTLSGSWNTARTLEFTGSHWSASFQVTMGSKGSTDPTKTCWHLWWLSPSILWNTPIWSVTLSHISAEKKTVQAPIKSMCKTIINKPPMSGNGKFYTTYIFMVMTCTGGWCVQMALLYPHLACWPMEVPDQPFALFHEAVPIVHDLHSRGKDAVPRAGAQQNRNAGVNRKSQIKIVSRRMVLKNLQNSCDLINKHGDSMRMCESRNMCGFKKEFSHYRHLMDEVLPNIKKKQ